MTPVVTSGTDQDIDGPEESADTGYYVYGVVKPGEGRLPEGLTGLDQQPVELVGSDTVAAVVGRIGLDRPPGRRAELVAHSEVLDALAATGPVVPIQFGSVMEDEASILDVLIAPNEDYFAVLLEELTGRVQFNLRASYHEHVVLAEVVAADPEIAELRERTRDLPEDAGYRDRVRLGELVARALEDKRAYDAAVLMDAVVPYVVDHVPREGAGIDQLLDVALLVDEERRAEFEEQLEGLAEAVHERIRLRLVGPVAPYDFVGGQ